MPTSRSVCGGYAVLLLYGIMSIMISGWSTSGSAKTIIEYWSPWSGIWQEMQEQIVGEFNASQNDVEVKYVLVPSAVLRERLILAQTPPDVIVLWGFGALELAPQGILRPLDALIARDLRTEEFFPVTLQQYRWNGRIWAAAYGVAANALIYNQQVLDEAGVGEPPATLADLEAAARKIQRVDAERRLTRIGYLPLDIWGGFLNFSYLFGADYYDLKTGRITAATTPTRQALEWIVDYYANHGGYAAIDALAQTFGANEDDPFIGGRLAMKLSHSWYMALIHRFAPDLDWGVAPLPRVAFAAAPSGPLLGSDALAMPARSAPRGGLGLPPVDDDAGQERWAEIQGIHSGWLHAARVNWEGWVPRDAYAIYTASIQQARPVPPIPIVDYLMGRLGARVGEVLRGESWPERALSEVQRESQQRLDEIVGER